MKIGKIEPRMLAQYRRLQSIERHKEDRSDYITSLELDNGKFGVAFYSEKKRENSLSEISDCYLTILDNASQAEAVIQVLTRKRGESK